MSLRPGIDLIQIRFGLASARLGFAWDQRWTKRVPEEHHSGASEAGAPPGQAHRPAQLSIQNTQK